MFDDRIITLRGALLYTTTANAMTEHTVQSHDEFVAVLNEIFGLQLPHSAALWRKTWQIYLAFQQPQSN